jgi:hypothetical protein
MGYPNDHHSPVVAFTLAGCAGERLTGRTKCGTVSVVLSNASATRDQVATAMEMGRGRHIHEFFRERKSVSSPRDTPYD